MATSTMLIAVAVSVAAITVVLSFVAALLACHLKQIQFVKRRERKKALRRISSTRSTAPLVAVTDARRGSDSPPRSPSEANGLSVNVRDGRFAQNGAVMTPAVVHAAHGTAGVGRMQRSHSASAPFRPALQPLAENQTGERVYHVLEANVYATPEPRRVRAYSVGSRVVM